MDVQVIVHNSDQAALVAATARALTIFARTPPGAAGYAGPQFLQAMIPATERVLPLIDCGDDPGLAWRALELGWRHLLFTGPDPLFKKVQDAAAAVGAIAYRPADLPVPILDLAGLPDVTTALTAFFHAHSG